MEASRYHRKDYNYSQQMNLRYKDRQQRHEQQCILGICLFSMFVLCLAGHLTSGTSRRIASHSNDSALRLPPLPPPPARPGRGAAERPAGAATCTAAGLTASVRSCTFARLLVLRGILPSKKICWFVQNRRKSFLPPSLIEAYTRKWRLNSYCRSHMTSEVRR